MNIDLIINNLDQKVSELTGQINYLENENKKISIELENNKKEKDFLEEVISLIEQFNCKKQEQIIETINKYATSILSIVDDNLELKSSFEIKAGRTQLNLFVYDKKNGVTTDIFDFGGSLVHLISLIFKIVLLDILRPGIPLIFDEPATYVDVNNQIKLGQFLSDFCRQYKRQIIVITHIDALKGFADRIIEIKKENGRVVIN